MRKWYWYITAYARKHGWVVIGSILVAIIIFSVLMQSIVTALEQPDRIYVGLVGEYTLQNLPPEVTKRISAGLTQIEPDGSVSSLLAERWTTEQDGTRYRFILRPNILWQDGQPLTTQDIRYPFQDVETIATQNDVVFNLPARFAPFPLSVSEPLIRYETQSYLGFLSRQMPIGIGTYRVIDYKRAGQRLTEISVDHPDVRIIYRIFQTEEDALTQFKRGEIDYLANLNTKPSVAEWPNVTHTSEVDPQRYVALFFNISSGKFPKPLRQALSYAITNDSEHIRANGPISPESWAYLEGGKSYEHDWDRATERLLGDLPGQPLNLELMTTSLFLDQAERIKRDLESFSAYAYQKCMDGDEISEKDRCVNTQIIITLRVSNFPDLSTFDLLLVGQEAPHDPDQYALWHSEQPSNFTGYKNTRIDTLLERGRQTLDQRERIQIYQEFQQFFLEDAPAIFLHRLENHTVFRSSAEKQVNLLNR